MGILQLISLSLFLFLLCPLVASSVTYEGNYALSFDGVNDFVAIQPTYLDDGLNDIWTLEAWINPTATQSFWQLNIVGFAGRHPNLEYCGESNSQCPKGAPLTQLREANGEYFVVVGDPNRLTPDSWHHVCGTWDNVTLNLYVDGKLDASIKPYEKNYTEGRDCTGYDCDVGIQIGGYRLRTPTGIFANQYFRGYIDEVRVWKVGRTQDEIASTMSKTLTGSEPGLQYYWRFDEGRGAVVKSHAMDAYGLLGAGQQDMEPRFVKSTAPIAAGSKDVGERDTIVIEKNSPMAVAAGAMIAVFFMFGGVCIGFLVGWKVHEKKIPLRFLWESEGLLSPRGSDRRDSFDEHMELRDSREETGNRGAAPPITSPSSSSASASSSSSSAPTTLSFPTSFPSSITSSISSALAGPSSSDKGKAKVRESDRDAAEEDEEENSNLLN